MNDDLNISSLLRSRLDALEPPDSLPSETAARAKRRRRQSAALSVLGLVAVGIMGALFANSVLGTDLFDAAGREVAAHRLTPSRVAELGLCARDDHHPRSLINNLYRSVLMLQDGSDPFPYVPVKRQEIRRISRTVWTFRASGVRFEARTVSPRKDCWVLASVTTVGAPPPVEKLTAEESRVSFDLDWGKAQRADVFLSDRPSEAEAAVAFSDTPGSAVAFSVYLFVPTEQPFFASVALSRNGHVVSLEQGWYRAP
jgi:hypothetical protein